MDLRLDCQIPMFDFLPKHRRFHRTLSILLIALWAIAALHGVAHACESDLGSPETCALCLVVGTAVLVVLAAPVYFASVRGITPSTVSFVCLTSTKRPAFLRGPPFGC